MTLLTDEERFLNMKIAQKKWRAANKEAVNELTSGHLYSPREVLLYY